MAHVSKKKLSENVEKALRTKLVEALRVIGKDKKVSYALKELLTYTESTMLAKRLAIVYLIHKDKSILDICETLNVSSSTVIRMWDKYDRGGYKSIEQVFHKLEPSILDMIEMFLSIMPPIVGKGRLKRIVGDE
ncbi:MAG: helix-turn-helix domain-containing protein [Minisyncoccia bacterium]